MALVPLAEPSTVAFARSVLASRQSRYAAFPDIDFADAEWGVLLDLFVAAEEGTCISLSSLVVSAGVPKTTALRAIADLVESGHLIREPDPRDGRRNYAFLTPDIHVRLHQLIRKMMTHFPS